VPVSVTVCGELAALSAIDTVALKVAIEVGVKVTEMLQLAPAASAVPQVFVCAKLAAPAPVTVMPEILSGALPLLLSCAVWVALATPLVEVKVSVAGVTDAIGAVTAVPAPVKATVCGEPEALSAIESDAL